MSNIALVDWLKEATGQLAEICVVADLEARLLASEVLSLTTAQLLTQPDRKLSEDEQARLELVLDRRLAREPMAYILGRREFADFELLVDSRVLIPRPETEMILEYAVAIIRDDKISTVHEIGTGSGALAIGMARAIPNLRVIASDISPDALAVARANVEHFGLAGQIELVEADLASHITSPTELVVANLPYLPVGLAIEPELGFEPDMALWSGEDGLEHYRQLLTTTSAQRFVLELGPRQYEPLQDWLLTHAPAYQISPIVAAGVIVGIDIATS